MTKENLVNDAVDAAIASWEGLKANPYIEASAPYMNFSQGLLTLVADKKISQRDAAFPLLLSTIAGMPTFEELADLERLKRAATITYQNSDKMPISVNEQNCLKSIVAQMVSRNFDRTVASDFPVATFDRASLEPQVLRFLTAYETLRGEVSTISQ